MEIFVTIPPGAPFIKDIARVPEVAGFRFNTGLPLAGDLASHLEDYARLAGRDRLWVDLKSREIKLLAATTISPSSKVLEINHEIEATPPFALYYNEGRDLLQIERVSGGNKLHVYLPPRVPVDFAITFDAGASFNIPDARVLDGPLTARDRAFIIAAREAGIHTYCLSYVEDRADIEAVRAIDQGATIIAKIESKRGLQLVQRDAGQPWLAGTRLMAARGDLYVELDRPHEILSALATIIKADPRAIGASRVLLSMQSPDAMPACADICDVGFMMGLGYTAFLLGDEMSDSEAAIKSAIGMLRAIDAERRAGRF